MLKSHPIDQFCFENALKNSLVALLETLFMQILLEVKSRCAITPRSHGTGPIHFD